MIRSAIASVSSRNGPTGMIPALLMSTSSGPRRSSTSFRKRSKLASIGHVERQPDRSAAQFLSGLLGERGFDVADREPCALRDQRGGRRAADSPGPAGDRDDLPDE